MPRSDRLTDDLACTLILYELLQLNRHESPTESVAGRMALGFDDGQMLASGGFDKKVKLWRSQ
jgi:hypothetical protein